MFHPTGGKGNIFFCLPVSECRLSPSLTHFFFFLSQNDPAHQECNFRITVISPAPGDRKRARVSLLSASVCCLTVTWWNHQLHCLPAPSLWDILQHKTQVFLISFFRSVLWIMLVMELLAAQMSAPLLFKLFSSALQNIWDVVISKLCKVFSAICLPEHRRKWGGSVGERTEFLLFVQLCCCLTQAEPGLNLQEILCCLSPGCLRDLSLQRPIFHPARKIWQLNTIGGASVLLGGVYRVLLPLKSFFNTLKSSQRGKRLDWELT